MKIMICDDSQLHLTQLADLCRTWIQCQMLEAEIVCTSDPETVLRDPCDILILDIEMPERNGIEIKEILSRRHDSPMIIFATSHDEYMPDAFGRYVMGFLRKPVNQHRFNTVMCAAQAALFDSRIYTQPDGQGLDSRDIVMVEAKANYTTVLLANGLTLPLFRKSMKQWETELTEYGFLRVDNSSLVNIRYICKFVDQEICLHNGETLTVSTRRRKSCYEAYLAYQRRHARVL